MHVCMCVCVSTHICVGVHKTWCVLCVSVSMHVCVYICVSGHVCVGVHINVVCVYVSACIYGTCVYV